MEEKQQEMDSPLEMVFSSSAFQLQTTRNEAEKGITPFDAIMRSQWKKAYENGVFNYSIKDVQTKVLPGKFSIVVQLNEKRLVLRRKPDDIHSVRQPFEPKKFNFTKIKQEEILFNLKYTNRNGKVEKNGHKTCNDVMNKASETRLEDEIHGSMVINTAPICETHSLLVPQLMQCKPQVVDASGLTLAIQTVLLSNSPAWRIGLNSLCGLASVNHYHYHVYYLHYPLYIQTADCKQIAGPCYEFEDYFAKGFVFQLEDDDVDTFVRNVMILIDYLLENEIPHNIYITRAVKFHKKTTENVYDTIRLVVWAQKGTKGVKTVGKFSVALAELAGHIPVYETNTWETLTEDEVASFLAGFVDDVYNQLYSSVKELYENV
ncbi:GDP-D-glucose phosphorylase 1 [Oratosquilla oratoria]|uniref:GDP-D-glucose phosphorylase 1 n=1 Tax=Oratosquilla oratoria TaxID=337810 RepID=UPI003F76C04A